ncbi:MAG TPA: hypothetical protein VKR05_01510 [Candidatus Cybelea sp.]|nr:hypothetical protein [Candidatus Cybelea sp.]
MATHGVENQHEHPRELRTHDRFGNRIDEVRFHPAWHALMTQATRAGRVFGTLRNVDARAIVERAAGATALANA